uniref:Uncharacterized protein n=1 Tax=Triticum urartu TaxID=4572 RepID=A0A8R7TGD0_TRIUA
MGGVSDRTTRDTPIWIRRLPRVCARENTPALTVCIPAAVLPSRPCYVVPVPLDRKFPIGQPDGSRRRLLAQPPGARGSLTRGSLASALLLHRRGCPLDHGDVSRGKGGGGGDGGSGARRRRHRRELRLPIRLPPHHTVQRYLDVSR